MSPLLALAPASAATPGGVFLMGHDPDFHGHFGPNQNGAQNIMKRAVDYVTSGKAAPHMLFVTDLHDPGAGHEDPRLGLNDTFGPGTYDVADDGSSGLALDLHTVNFANYDIVMVGSDFGGWLRQAELDILNARSPAVISYINNGGGLVAQAESGVLTQHGFYGYLPFVVSSSALNQSETANTVTPFGASLGLTNSDINGNFSHNIFTSTGPLQVVDQDPSGNALSIAERGLVVPSVNTTLSGGGQTGPAITVFSGTSVTDKATLSGATSDAGGTMMYVVFSDNHCTSAYAMGGSFPVTNGIAPPSNPVSFPTAGTYYWVASYSGDAHNVANQSSCGSEVLTVLPKASPTIATTPSPSVPVGGMVSDSATLSGGNHPSGTISFQLFGPGDTSCSSPISTTAGAINASGTATSGSVQVNSPGTYRWVATYAGDASNNGAVSPCGSETVTVTPQTLTGRAYGLSANIKLASAFVTVFPTPDTGPVATTGSSQTNTPCVAKITGSNVNADVLCTSVSTTATPASSTAAASVADVTLSGLAGIPTVSAATVQSTSTTSCAGSSGTTTIAFLQVGDVVVISRPTNVAPNTHVTVGVVNLVLNEQSPFSSPDKGLTVNAIHLTVNTVGLATVNMIVSSSESDIKNCP